jgi:hypothetical protein
MSQHILQRTFFSDFTTCKFVRSGFDFSEFLAGVCALLVRVLSPPICKQDGVSLPVAVREGGKGGGEEGGELSEAVRGLQRFGEEVKEMLQVGGGSEVQVWLGVGVWVGGEEMLGQGKES